MEPKKSSFLFAFVFASLLLSSMAGGQRKFLKKDQVGSMAMETSESMQQQEDEEVLAVAHERILRQQVKTNDYGSYDPSPTMAKPHFKDIPN